VSQNARHHILPYHSVNISILRQENGVSFSLTVYNIASKHVETTTSLTDHT